MRKYILTIIILLNSIFGYAQKVKIDKGEIKLDEKTVAYIQGKKPLFKIFSLDKNFTISIELKQILPVPAIPIMELKNEGIGKFNEIEFTTGKFNPFNSEKSVVNAMVERNYLNASGLNTEAIENFVNGEPSGVSAKLLGVQNNLEEEKKIIDSYQLSIDDAGTIQHKSTKSRSK